MSWNYRVCHRPTVAGGGFNIHEVYYDDEGRIILYSENPITPFGDIREELECDMSQMIDAFNQDTLNLNHVDHLISVHDNVFGSDKSYK
jgi:hypothetical protein